MNKFAGYANDKKFACVLYLFNKRPVFDSYRKILSRMKEKVRAKVILGFCKNIGEKNVNLKNALYWFEGKAIDFETLWGDRE